MVNGSKRRKVGGIVAHRGPGKVWTWQVRNRTYRWCPLGNVEEWLIDGGIVRVAHMRSLDGAVAYTVGYSDGQTSVLCELHPEWLKETQNALERKYGT